MGIGVVLERFWVDDLVGKFATNDYGKSSELIRKNHRQGQYQMYPKPHFS
jgi:hypothetical protein